jgi:glycolate oxidase FAD binding subunit
LKLEPKSPEEAGEALATFAEEGHTVQPVGGETRPGWAGADCPETDRRISSRGMKSLIEHNHGDYTALVEAGMPLSEAQRIFGEAGQMLAWDPSLGQSEAATVGGIMATADSGPLRHRFGGVRDTVIGAKVVLSDGLVASSGGRVIKNVAGYDLAKIFTGSYGCLGFIASVAVRLQPLPARTASVIWRSDHPARLGAAAIELARLPLELDSLDLRWSSGQGALLARISGATAVERATGLASRIDLGQREVVEDDDEIWRDQRDGQRSSDGVVLKLSSLTTDLPELIEAAEAGNASLVARAALGLSWLKFEPGPDLAERVESTVRRLSKYPVFPLDGAERVPTSWPRLSPGLESLNKSLKQRLDPGGIFRPGAMSGGN